MKAGIITIPSRESYLKSLVPLIKPSVDELRIFVDTELKGHWFNLSRCMREMLGEAKIDEPILIMCDDVTTVKDWKSRWELIHNKAKNNIYVMMTRQRHLCTEENRLRGYITKCQPRGCYDHANIFINQQNLIPNIMKWFEDIGKYTKPLEKRSKHFDVVIQEYLIYHNIPWTITIPTLFNHIGNISTLGHNVGGSPCYIGDSLNE
jgi:hypothetical protein